MNNVYAIPGEITKGIFLSLCHMAEVLRYANIGELAAQIEELHLLIGENADEQIDQAYDFFDDRWNQPEALSPEYYAAMEAENERSLEEQHRSRAEELEEKAEELRQQNKQQRRELRLRKAAEKCAARSDGLGPNSIEPGRSDRGVGLDDVHKDKGSAQSSEIRNPFGLGLGIRSLRSDADS